MLLFAFIELSQAVDQFASIVAPMTWPLLAVLGVFGLIVAVVVHNVAIGDRREPPDSVGWVFGLWLFCAAILFLFFFVIAIRNYLTKSLSGFDLVAMVFIALGGCVLYFLTAGIATVVVYPLARLIEKTRKAYFSTVKRDLEQKLAEITENHKTQQFVLDTTLMQLRQFKYGCENYNKMNCLYSDEHRDTRLHLQSIYKSVEPQISAELARDEFEKYMEHYCGFDVTLRIFREFAGQLERRIGTLYITATNESNGSKPQTLADRYKQKRDGVAAMDVSEESKELLVVELDQWFEKEAKKDIWK
jgi:hypothetical protein